MDKAREPLVEGLPVFSSVGIKVGKTLALNDKKALVSCR